MKQHMLTENAMITKILSRSPDKNKKFNIFNNCLSMRSQFSAALGTDLKSSRLEQGANSFFRTADPRMSRIHVAGRSSRISTSLLLYF